MEHGFDRFLGGENVLDGGHRDEARSAGGGSVFRRDPEETVCGEDEDAGLEVGEGGRIIGEEVNGGEEGALYFIRF